MIIFRNRFHDCSDERLMQYLQQGKEAAFEVLYDRYSRKLLYYFHRMLGGDQEKAQDFVQDLFLKIIEQPRRFDPQKKFSTWIYAIAFNLCKNEYRRLTVRRVHQRHATAEAEDLHGGNGEFSVEQNLDHQSFMNRLLGELQKLDENQRHIFILRFQENLPVREIARMMDCREGTVKSRLFHITRKLAGRLQAFHPVNQEEKIDEDRK